MPAARPPKPPPLPPPDHKVVTVKRYEARPPVENQLVEPGETVATTKEEEWVTKKTREMTTRRQIATRVQRQVVLEDGKVLEDSGPLLSTTTNEDTETQEHEHTEHRRLDEPPGHDGTGITEGVQPEIEGVAKEPGLLALENKAETQQWTLVANPEGKVREIKEKRVLTHEEIDELKEEQEIQHFGDITDKAYLKAVSSGKEDIRESLKTCTEEDLNKALVSSGPKLVHESVKSKKTIDTEEKEESRAVNPDGKILTESKVTTEHEEINDEDLPEDEARSLSSGSIERRKESGQRWRKTKDQHFVDHFAGDNHVSREMKYNAETEEGEKFGDPGMEDPYDWDSLSTRIRKQRRHRTLMQRQRDADDYYERKDALTQKPLDYELEEEIRKKETSKWLEHHFGSDSRSSRDSLGDEIDEGPNTSYFNVTIKSQQASATNGKAYKEPPKPKFPQAKPYTAHVTSSSRVFVPSPEPEVQTPPRVKGYFQGISEWSQRKAEETKSSPRVVDSPPSPDRRTPIRSSTLQRDDSAYVSSSTVNTPYKRSSPERASPFQSLERRMSPERPYSPPRRAANYKQFNGKSHEETRYDRGPTPPERKRATQRKREEVTKYENGYRSRNETSYHQEEEPAPDYSPPRVRETSRSPSPPRRTSRKSTQRTRFEEQQKPPQEQQRSGEKLSVGAAIGKSIRKLVGKIRSASQERRARHKSRSPSPRRGSVTYRQYGSVDTDPPAANQSHNHHPNAVMDRRNGPVQRYYLGEDPFGGSIYGRENKYDTQRIKNYTNGHTNGHDERSNFTTTLGRFSKSTSKLTHNGYGNEDYSRNSQTLPRKLHDEEVQKKTYNHSISSPQRQWENDRLTKNKRSSSTINVSIVNVTPPSSNVGVNKPTINGNISGPVKPARTYKALNRSKSFNVQAMEPVHDVPKTSYFGNRLNSSSIYKSNPHLSRLDETPEQLKSPGIVSIISRSQRDLSSALQNEELERKENLFSSNMSKTSYTNGYNRSYENGVSDKKKIFMRGLLEKAPELYHTLHGDEESDGVHRKSPAPIYATPIKNGIKKPLYFEESVYKPDQYKRESNSPYRPINGVDKFKASEGYNTNGPNYTVTRRGSANSDNFSETFRSTSRSDDPRRPSVTDTVKTISKKTIPSKDGRAKETIESTETTTVTKSRFVDQAKPTIKYIENGSRYSGLGNRRGSGQSIERRGSNGVVIEVKDYRK